MLNSDPVKSNITEQVKAEFVPALFVAESKYTVTELPESANLAETRPGAGVGPSRASIVTLVDAPEYPGALAPETTRSIRYLQSDS